MVVRKELIENFVWCDKKNHDVHVTNVTNASVLQ